MVIVQDIRHVRLLTLNHASKHNPFSEKLENAIKHALHQADADKSVKSIVVYGGNARSFSSGGDFNEVKNLSGGAEVEYWIDRVISLYQTVLKINKPTVAAIDGYAIGMGFQFAMMFDQRIMSEHAIFSMPELKHGIGCSVGAAILTYTHGHAMMQKILLECARLSAEQCYAYNIVHLVTPRDILLSTALEKASLLAEYPETALLNTKQFINKNFIDTLEKVKEESKIIHKKTFAMRDMQKHFQHVLGKNYSLKRSH